MSITSAETYLWRAVVQQAITDGLDLKLEPVVRDAAYMWFYDNLDDFRRVCEWADLDPQAVRSAFLKAHTRRQKANSSLQKQQTKKTRVKLKTISRARTKKNLHPSTFSSSGDPMTPIYKDALLPLHYSNIPACRSCGHTVGYVTRPKPPHVAGLRCLQCQRFIHWLKRSIAIDLCNNNVQEDYDGD